jgi:hypothetical protein
MEDDEDGLSANWTTSAGSFSCGVEKMAEVQNLRIYDNTDRSLTESQGTGPRFPTTQLRCQGTA